MGIYQRRWQLTDASRSGGFVRFVMEVSCAPCHDRPENSRWLHSDGVNVKRDDWIINAVIQSGRREWKSSSVSDCDSTSCRHCFVSLKSSEQTTVGIIARHKHDKTRNILSLAVISGKIVRWIVALWEKQSCLVKKFFHDSSLLAEKGLNKQGRRKGVGIMS